MKSTKAIKNIRLFKNGQNGKPKRVTTGVDDYGNRFHVVNGKAKPALSKFGKAKKNAKATKNQNMPVNSPLIDHWTARHYRSISAREKQLDSQRASNNGKVSKRLYDKLHYHENRAHTRIRKDMNRYDIHK